MAKHSVPEKYPARCRPATHTSSSLPDEGREVCLHGRLLALDEGGGRLLDEEGVASFRLKGPRGEVRAGDIVEIRGHTRRAELWVEEMRPLVQVPGENWGGPGDWWRFHSGAGSRRRNLYVRAAVLRAVRDFFAVRGFLEVETPALVRAPGQEAHLHPFASTYGGVEGRAAQNRYLITSPEHHMKRLLGSGFEKIFQICRCFRNEECGRAHNPEFTMIEWYRAYASYEEIMEDVEDLVAHTCRALRCRTRITYQNAPIDLEAPWRRLRVDEAFALYAGIDLNRCLSAAALCRAARARGCSSAGEEDSWEDLFFKVMLEIIEPALARSGPALLMDYPASMAALARLKEGEPRVAERVEAYAGGLELANGFTELNDPGEQRRRFESERRKRRILGGAALPLDEAFLRMMGQGMPPAGGVALGLDRLVMLLADAASIDEVLAFPFVSA